ncbi:hypothetical protein JX266_014281, partial [Neoarthrinium moseri]
TGKFAASIANGTSSRILLRESPFDGLATTNPPMQRQPDAQFQHHNAAYPGVVLEISYSQNGKDLDRLAWDYILKSNGDIRVVIGIDLDYGGTNVSSVSVWRAVFLREEGEELESLDVKREITCQPFRNADRSRVNQSAKLDLYLDEFATDALPDKCERILFSMTFEKLAELLDKAEGIHEAREAGQIGKGIRSKPRTRKRKRSSSPVDALRSEDEEVFRDREQRTAQRSAASDSDFEVS